MQNIDKVLFRQSNGNKFLFLIQADFCDFVGEFPFWYFTCIIKSPYNNILVFAGWDNGISGWGYFKGDDLSCVAFKSSNDISFFCREYCGPDSNSRISRPCYDILSVAAKLESRNEITVTFQRKLISHWFNIPNLQTIFGDWGYHISLATKGDSSFLGQFKYDGFVWASIPHP